jgi:gliding motility-associated-like protein
MLTSAAYSQTNLVPNGDFEIGPDSSSIGWICTVDTNCSCINNVTGPDSWVVIDGSPDRIIESNIPICNWDNFVAKSGKSWVDFGDGEAGEAILIMPLTKGSLYKISCNLSLETFRGTDTNASRVAFIFNNGSDSLLTPLINFSQNWYYWDTTFSASENSSKIKLIGVGNSSVLSAVRVDDIFLKSIIIDTVIIVPNVFTPNSDFINDVFYIKGLEMASKLKIEIYNRWGIRVFDANNPNIDWDGKTTSGENCTDGIYYYLIEAIINNRKINKKGFVELIR